MAVSRWWYLWDDPADTWTGEDKLAHVGWSMALYAWAAPRMIWPLGFVLMAGLAIEFLELLRYRRWVDRGMPSPWPFLTDKISAKDLLADLAGALLMRGALAL